MADMEGQSRSSAGVSQLESKIQDLEERLRSEERYGVVFHITQTERVEVRSHENVKTVKS